MAALPGAEFERAWLNQVIRLQDRALTITEREAERGGVTGLRNWADTMTPVLESQLRAAKRNLAAASVLSQR